MVTSTVKRTQGIDYVTEIRNGSPSLMVRLMRYYLRFLNWISPTRASKQVLNLFLTPRGKSLSQQQLAWYQSGICEDIEINGNQLFTWRSGNNPSTLLLHGWGSSSYRLYHLIDYLINQGIEVMTIDLPAHGKSSGSKTNLRELEFTIYEVLKRNPNLQNIIGYSFGGVVLLDPLTKIEMKKVVLIGSPKNYKTVTHPFFQMLDVPTPLIPQFYRDTEQIVGRVKEDWLQFEGIAKSQKVLMVHDEHDQIVPIKSTEDMVDKLSNVTLYSTQNLGHRGLLKPNHSFDIIVQFLKGTS